MDDDFSKAVFGGTMFTLISVAIILLAYGAFA